MAAITKEQFKQALDEGRVIITGEMKTRNGWTGFNVYILELGSDRPWYRLLNIGPYWSEARRLHHCTAGGTSRALEIILGIGYRLGLKFDEMPQSGFKII